MSPVPDNGIHNNIKNERGDNVSLPDPLTCSKCSAIISRLAHDQFIGFPDQREQALEQVITPIGEPAHYSISIPPGFQGRVGCPVEGCPFVVKADRPNKRGQMRNHFRARHFEYTIVIEEEGRLPQCRLCGIFMRDATSVKHQQSAICKYHAEKRKRYFQAKRQASKLQKSGMEYSINNG